MKIFLSFLKKYFLENSDEKQRIVKNSFWLALARFGGSLFRAILIIYAFRTLGPSLQGSFSLAMNFVLIFSFIPDFGLTAVLIREIAKFYEERRKIFANTFLSLLFLLFASLLIINLTKNIFIKDKLALSLIFLLSIFLIFDTLREFLYAIFRTQEKMELQAFSHLLTNFFLLIFGIIFLKINPLPIYLVYAYLLGVFLGFLFTILLLRKEIFYNYFQFFQTKIAFSLFNKSWPIGLANFLFLILTYIDSLIVGWFHSAKDVGLYNSVIKLTEFFYFFPAALAMSVFPIVAKKENQEQLKETIHFALSFALLISLPMFAGLFLLAKDIILLLYGTKYLEASLALSLLSFSLPFNFLLLILIDVLIALDKRRELLLYDFFIVFLNFFLNLLFVPKYSYFAASLITSFSAFASLIFAYFICKKYLDLSFRKINFINYFLASILMGVFVSFLPFHLILKIIFGALIYFGLLYLLKDELLLHFLKRQ